jgi:DNA-binding NarL/FixJ family response regulator
VRTEGEAGRPRALVAGDEPLLARGVALLLDTTRDIDAVYVDSLTRARRFLASGQAELVVWAGDYLNEETLGGLRKLREQYRAMGLCLVARRADAEALEALVAHSGERLAFVLYSGGLDAAELGDLVRSVLRGRSTIDPALLERLTAAPSGADELNLTDSEREIMELVAVGLRNREIGRRLFKSEKAVEKHVGRLFAKLGLPPETTGHLDRRVAATRIYLSFRAGRGRGLVDRGDLFEAPSAQPCG